jgi:predicted RNA binding protein YcfA (HicA-like mRNA interferase family)
MPVVPLLRPGEAAHAFERLGWRVARQPGSHIVPANIVPAKQGLRATLSAPDHDEVDAVP